MRHRCFFVAFNAYPQAVACVAASGDGNDLSGLALGGQIGYITTLGVRVELDPPRDQTNLPPHIGLELRTRCIA